MARALKAGCDIDCGAAYGVHMQASMNEGLTSEKDLDVAVRRALTLRFRLG